MRALLALLLASGPSFAALEVRDIDRDGTADAYYDTTQGLTWLTAASAGPATFAEALEWADRLEFAGYADWRLPQSFTYAGCNYSYGSPDCWLDPQTPDFSEVAMFASQGALLADWTWLVGLSGESRAFYFADLQEGPYHRDYLASAIAVRAGDVQAARLEFAQPIPEPSTWASLAVGLAALVLSRRSFRSRNTASCARTTALQAS
jgi:hypothetical protein